MIKQMFHMDSSIIPNTTLCGRPKTKQMVPNPSGKDQVTCPKCLGIIEDADLNTKTAEQREEE